MADSAPEKDKLVPISEAARVLGVSIATVRRWDAQGKLHAVRKGGEKGRYRYFSLAELEGVKLAAPLTISEAAHSLGLSANTLRRLEEQGLISPERTRAGERVYTHRCLEEFVNSQYWLSRTKVQEKVLEPFVRRPDQGASGETGGGDSASDTTSREAVHSILAAATHKNKVELSRLVRFRQSLLASGSFLTATFVLLVAVLTTLFFLWPEDMGKFFGYYRENRYSALSMAEVPNDSGGHTPQVLGIQSNDEQRSNVATALYPFSRVSLNLLKLIDEEKYNRAVPLYALDDINNIFAITDEGYLVPRYPLTISESSYLNIPDGSVTVKNLDADYVRGRAPGDSPGDIVVLNDEGNLELTGTIVSASVGTTAIIDGSVTAEKIADGVLFTGLADDSVASQHIIDGEVKAADIAAGAVTTAKIASSAVTSVTIDDGTVVTVDLADDSITTDKIVEGAVLSIDIADGTVATSDLADGSVQTIKLADGSVTSVKIADGTIASADIAADAVTAAAIADDAVLESHLKAVDAAGDEECLTFETTTGDFEWQSCGSGGSSTFTLAGTSGSNQTISDGDTLTIAAGTGITTTGGATDTVTIASTLGTSIAGSEVDDDALDFAQFQDTLDLDAATELNLGNTNFTFDLDGTGDFIVADAGVAFATFADDGTATFTGTLSAPTLTLTGSGTLNGLDSIDATTETTLEGALDIAGDVTGTGLGSVTIGSDKVLESHLKAVDAAGDEECLTYETTTGDFEWQTCGGGVTADSLDFIDFEDTLDLDAALTLNQTTNTWTQTFTGLTTTGLTYTANELTSGTALAVASSASRLDGSLGSFTMSGSNSLNTGNVLKVASTGTLNTGKVLFIDNDAVAGVALDIDAENTTADIVNISAAALTTANALDIPDLDALTTGKALQIASGSEAISSGELGTFALTSSGSANTAKTGNLFSIAASRTDTRTTGTTADDYDLLNLSRTSIQNGSGGTTTATGSVLRIENVATQTAGTLTDTVKGIEIVMDADGSGDGIFIDSDGTGTTSQVSVNIDSESTTTDIVAVDGTLLTTGDALQLSVDTDALSTGAAIRVRGTSTGTSDVFTVDGTGSITAANASAAHSLAGASLAIPNGSGPTVDAAGEIAIDTTNDQLKYYGTAGRVLSYSKSKSVSLESPTDTDNFNLWKTEEAITITQINCVVDPADTGESAVITIEERDGNADTPAGVDGATTITCANTNTADDGSLSNPTIDSGDWISLDVGTVTGTVTQLTVTITYTTDGT